MRLFIPKTTHSVSLRSENILKYNLKKKKYNLTRPAAASVPIGSKIYFLLNNTPSITYTMGKNIITIHIHKYKLSHLSVDKFLKDLNTTNILINCSFWHLNKHRFWYNHVFKYNWNNIYYKTIYLV